MSLIPTLPLPHSVVFLLVSSFPHDTGNRKRCLLSSFVIHSTVILFYQIPSPLTQEMKDEKEKKESEKKKAQRKAKKQRTKVKLSKRVLDKVRSK